MTLRIAGGTVPGTSHTMVGQPGWVNNQDAFAWKLLAEDGVVAIVCDGCGSGKHSEVGAKLGARLVAEQLAGETAELAGRSLATLPWERVRTNLLAQFHALAQAMGGRLSETINNYFLFTIVGVLVTGREVQPFSLGDGMYRVDDRLVELSPLADNAPAYLMYGLVGSRLLETDPGRLDFQPGPLLQRDEVEVVMIGTDGVMDIGRAADKRLPGTTKLVGPLAAFGEERMFTNPDKIRRRLAMMNAERIIDGSPTKGLLPDDTSLIVIRP